MTTLNVNAAMNDPNSNAILPPGKRAGVCLHITSLPGPFGIGEIGQHARNFIDKMNTMQLGVWQFLPTGPTAYGDSPYQPLSSFAGNELLIDIGELIEFGLLTTAETAALATLPSDFVDYGNLIPIKNRLLRLAASRFEATADAELKARCDHFVTHNDAPWLHDYALFRVLKTKHDEQSWPNWAPEFVHREELALRQVEASSDTEIADVKVIQFLFHDQWTRFRQYANDHGVRLFGDMPICIALDSSDAWANRELLCVNRDGEPDHVAGVPPDYFSEDGQLWGNPLYDWPLHAADGYGWWVDRLRAATELSDIVRIDHFRGFESYWSVPAHSQTARTGSWEPGPGDAIFDAMRAKLGSLPIVAEDLGVITPEVERLRDRHEIPGMIVLQFEMADEHFDLQEVGENSVCYTGTHDNDTTVGWFNGSPDDLRGQDEIEHTQQATLRLTRGTAETVHLDMISAAFETKARLAIAPMQDYLGLGSECRTNTPGTSSNNWRWRLRPDHLDQTVCDGVSSMVLSAGRGIES